MPSCLKSGYVRLVCRGGVVAPGNSNICAVAIHYIHAISLFVPRSTSQGVMLPVMLLVLCISGL